jgi:hypothetical protein
MCPNRLMQDCKKIASRDKGRVERRRKWFGIHVLGKPTKESFSILFFGWTNSLIFVAISKLAASCFLGRKWCKANLAAWFCCSDECGVLFQRKKEAAIEWICSYQ